MIQHRLHAAVAQDPAHYGAASDAFGMVLVQLGDSYGEQLRISMTPAQAEHFSNVLRSAIEAAKSEGPIVLRNDTPNTRNPS